MAKKYYWLKLKADWFSDKRIKKLRSIAGGDTYTIIYLKMMLLSFPIMSRTAHGFCMADVAFSGQNPAPLVNEYNF